MVKYISVAIVAVVLVIFLFFVLFNKKAAFNGIQKTSNTQVTSSSVDEDLTALEKDLLDLDETNQHFTEEINSL